MAVVSDVSMAVMIAACNLLILLGVWISGVNPDALFTEPDHFNQSRDVCLRHSWHKVAGVQEPVRLCYEWINLSDPSGNTHVFQPDTDIVLGAFLKDVSWSGLWLNMVVLMGFLLLRMILVLLHRTFRQYFQRQ